MELPETLHQQLETLARNEGIALSEYLVSALTRHATLSYTVRSTSEEETSKQRADFAALLGSLGQASFSEIENVLQEREVVMPEAGLAPEVMMQLQSRIAKQLMQDKNGS